MKDTIDNYFSAQDNYQAIMSKLDKKEPYIFNIFKFALVPTLALLLLIINFIYNSSTDNVFVNKLVLEPERRLKSEIGVISDRKITEFYPFVDNINTANLVKEKELVEVYADDSFYEATLTYVDEKKDKYLEISFVEDGDDIPHRIDKGMEPSYINGCEVIIIYNEGNHYAIFTYRGLDFMITTKGLELKELVNVLESIFI
jgi:hypothetical protein